MEADDLEKISDLGRGAYGVVEKMRHIPSGTIMAVKVRIFLLHSNIFNVIKNCSFQDMSTTKI